MAGRGFYVNFKVPELEAAVKNIGKYDAKTALKIENQIQNRPGIFGAAYCGASTT
jgi:hypothetical protein